MLAQLTLPLELEPVRKHVLVALNELRPAGLPQGIVEQKALILSSRTAGGRDLPEYYLVYFLLVDLLGFQNIGKWEKVAWTIPVRYQDRLYSIEHRKSGIGIFAPNYDQTAVMSGTSSD